MGTYDILPGGQQVKCWDSEGEDISFGDMVPRVGDEKTYSIALKEGGYANVINCELISITRKPRCSSVFDKWGNPWNSLQKKSYFFEGPIKRTWTRLYFFLLKFPFSIPIIWIDLEALRITRKNYGGVNIFWKDIFCPERYWILRSSVRDALKLIFTGEMK